MTLGTGRRLVVGVDSSTQSTKAEARDIETGEVVAIASSPHPPTTPPVSEQDPDAWWSAMSAAIEQLGDHRHDVAAISVCGQQHGLVVLDDGGRPLRPAKLWNDTTSAPQAARLVAELGPEQWAAATGSVPVASFTVSKLAWVAEHEPEILARVARLMLPHDYLTWRLTGEHVTDRGDASGTGWFDASTGSYRPDLVGAAVGGGDVGAGGDEWIDRLPRVLAPFDAAGEIVGDVAASLGLPAGVVVGPGSGDNMGAALGLGMARGDVAVSLGTSGTVFAVSSSATSDPSAAVAGFASADGGFLPLVCTLNATKVTDTVARWLGRDAAGLAELALVAADDPGTAMLVPYFDGERTPNLPDATGTFAGLTNATTPEQLALAAHDGVLCGVLDGLEALRCAGATVDGRLFLVGGGSRSVAYRQRCADLTGSAVTVPASEETVATGAAVQAAAVLEGSDSAPVAARWQLGAGTVVAPARDAGARRDAYRSVADRQR
ncbi:MAG: xylulokinase [Ilumatobacter sp.]|uniref:xylulokinase n=1 Tax=Ilumatobacter sp. TaxID=1967498 RepID=UPI0026069C72|nr:xylulokinase [Ilumatobacter sp.]MDJ0769522.1 xylulokinase [Ilumatobacter sp.]